MESKLLDTTRILPPMQPVRLHGSPTITRPGGSLYPAFFEYMLSSGTLQAGDVVVPDVMRGPHSIAPRTLGSRTHAFMTFKDITSYSEPDEAEAERRNQHSREPMKAPVTAPTGPKAAPPIAAPATAPFTVGSTSHWCLLRACG